MQEKSNTGSCSATKDGNTETEASTPPTSQLPSTSIPNFGESLMPTASFNSRFDKDLELGRAIKAQVEAGIPKGSLRAVSSRWLKTYLEYIEGLDKAQSEAERSVSC